MISQLHKIMTYDFNMWNTYVLTNRKFFHQRASQCQRKNQILGVYDSEGRWGTLKDSIAHTIEHYFQQLFTSSHLTTIDGMLNSVDSLVTLGMNATLLQRYNLEEVKTALFQMHPSKSLGPDGMTPFFFQKY